MSVRKIIAGIALAATIISIICLGIFRTDPPLNPDIIHEPSSENGFISEKIVGNPTEAKLVLYEYADFACSHCADQNKIVNNLMNEYDIALVFRYYNLNLNKNSPAAARAATAASIQGYFKEMKDLLFNNQADWYYKDGEELNKLFQEYFQKASNGSGNLDKFMEDYQSDAVKTRLKFEQNLGKKADLAGTPTFRIDGETIKPSDLTETIKQKITN